MNARTKPAITAELRNATAAYVAAQVHTATVRPIIESLKSEVLNTFNFEYAEEWQDVSTGKITDIKDVYMMSDEDFSVYSDLIHSSYLTAGFDVQPDYCPLLVAENNERKAAIAMVDAAQYITDYPYENLLYRLDLIPKFMETLVNLVNSIN